MGNYFEIDFRDVACKKSGDAIPLRYEIGGVTRIHVTDGGFQSTGEHLIKHINQYYGNPNRIDAVIVSHPDGDHTGGLRCLFEEYQIGELWMLRPWNYADELLRRFSRFKSVENLIDRLKKLYPNLSELERLAEEGDVPIREPFQGAQIGAFTVLAPTKERYLDCIVESERTPEARSGEQVINAFLSEMAESVANFVRSAWGEERFPSSDTSAENNMSVIQYAYLCEKSILLTADAGRAALTEAADYAPNIGLSLPGIDWIQVPHHGSRHNVSTELLDRWIGRRLDKQLDKGKGNFMAVISSAKEDENHPRKSVIRAFIHRGADVYATEGTSIHLSANAPDRGWKGIEPTSYPEDQEE